jgi:hypothetical protein
MTAISAISSLSANRLRNCFRASETMAKGIINKRAAIAALMQAAAHGVNEDRLAGRSEASSMSSCCRR